MNSTETYVGRLGGRQVIARRLMVVYVLQLMTNGRIEHFHLFLGFVRDKKVEATRNERESVIINQRRVRVRNAYDNQVLDRMGGWIRIIVT